MLTKKRMLGIAFASGLILASSSAATTITSLGRNTSILPNLQSKLNNNEFHISSINDLEKVNNNKMGRGNSTLTLVLDQDLDLSGMTTSDLSNFDAKYSGYINEIDGNGHSIKNKPADLFLKPLISYVWVDANGGLYVHNITFDDAPPAFLNTTTSALKNSVSSNHEEVGGNITEDRILYDDTATPNNSIYFQNVSIINTDVQNQQFDLKNDTVLNFGLLSRYVVLNEGGNPASDTVIRFNGLNLSNNKINNNVFNASLTTNKINFSLVSNIGYTVCSNDEHHHIGLIGFKNVIVQDNEFLGNEIKGASSNAVFSFSPLIASLEFDGINWVGSGGNFLKLESILIQNNSIEKPKGIADENFRYSDLISQSIDPKTASSLYTDVEALQEIISLNNNIYLDKDNDKYYEDSTIITIENVGLNSWTQEDADKLFFIGNSYNQGDDLNLFVDESGNANFNNITHLKVLNKSDNATEWNDMSMMLQREFGIYGVSMRPNNNGDLEEIEVSSQITNGDGSTIDSQDHVDVIEVSTELNNSQKVKGIKINFNLLLNSANNTNDSGDIIDEPVTINNVKMLNDGKVIATSNQDSYEAVNIEEMNYSFDVDFTFKKAISKFKADDYENLQLSFSYTDGTSTTRFARNTVVDLDAQELADFAAIGKINQDGGLAISAGVLGGIVGLILLILLILLLLILLRRYQVSKVKDVQDGYYEFEDEGTGFDNNAQYEYDNQYNDYYEDANYVDYEENNDQEYYEEDYNQEYYEEDYNQEYYEEDYNQEYYEEGYEPDHYGDEYNEEYSDIQDFGNEEHSEEEYF